MAEDGSCDVQYDAVRTNVHLPLLAPVHILRKSVHEMNSKPSKQIKEQFLDFANLRYY